MSSWWSALNPFAEVQAEEAKDDDKKDDKEEEENEHDEEQGGDEEGGDDEEEGGEEEEEEEEEEPEDPKPALVEHAKNHSCPAEKHHFDECAARVTKAQENPDEHKGHHEDCAEEFLHLMHCVDKTIAEPLFRQLK